MTFARLAQPVLQMESTTSRNTLYHLQIGAQMLLLDPNEGNEIPEVTFEIPFNQIIGYNQAN